MTIGGPFKSDRGAWTCGVSVPCEAENDVASKRAPRARRVFDSGAETGEV